MPALPCVRAKEVRDGTFPRRPLLGAGLVFSRPITTRTPLGPWPPVQSPHAEDTLRGGLWAQTLWHVLFPQ